MQVIPFRPGVAKPEQISTHVLIPYDRTRGTDEAVEYGLRWAQRQSARLFMLALAAPAADADPYFPPGAFLTDDLIAFAKLGHSLGVEVDGSCLQAPTMDAIRQVIASHGIDRVLLPQPRCIVDSPVAGLLRELGQDCPVPLSFVGDGDLEGRP